MRKFLHLVNPVAVGPGSDLFAAQPVTFAALTDARQRAVALGLDVHLCAVGYVEDAPAFPADFHRLPDLTRSVLDVGQFQQARKLPLLGDLIARALDEAETFGADTIIYSNVDISPMPDFYLAIDALLDQGYDAFSITRRTLGKDWPGGVRDLALMRAQVGEPHPGRDCFIFAREAARQYIFGSTCIGVTCVGKVLMANLAAHATNYADFKHLHLTFHLGDDRAWLAPELEDYAAHNRRELITVLRALLAAGLSSEAPASKKLASRLDSAAPSAPIPD